MYATAVSAAKTEGVYLVAELGRLKNIGAHKSPDREAGSRIAPRLDLLVDQRLATFIGVATLRSFHPRIRSQ